MTKPAPGGPATVFPCDVRWLNPHSRSHTGTLYASDLYLRVMRHNEGTWKVSLRPVASVVEKARAAWGEISTPGSFDSAPSSAGHAINL